jgi:hypothetical protein
LLFAELMFRAEGLGDQLMHGTNKGAAVRR